MKRIKITWVLAILFFFISMANAQKRQMQYWRPYTFEGINVFEPSKSDTVHYNGFKLRIGGNFTQQYQVLHQSNQPTEQNPDNTLGKIGGGFNTATANLNLDAQLADGIRMNLTMYLSSRHHSDTWVKGGYIQFDKLKFLHNDKIDQLMNYLTFKVGHMEINYGDMHFIRTDNGNSFYNPFVGNLLMDAFTTEIGGELYYQNHGWLAMAGATGGELHGDVVNPGQRAPSFYGKLGYDKQVSDNLRLRLTGSIYTTSSSEDNTLYKGDRGGARYYSVMVADGQDNFRSGRINPGLNDKVTSWVINPFIKYGGLEVMGDIESATGRGVDEEMDRTWNQYAGQVIYRFLVNERAYVGFRYNTVNGELSGSSDHVRVNREQITAGWYPLKYLLIKAEYVNQQYNDYPGVSIYHDGKFDGLMLEAAVAF